MSPMSFAVVITKAIGSRYERPASGARAQFGQSAPARAQLLSSIGLHPASASFLSARGCSMLSARPCHSQASSRANASAIECRTQPLAKETAITLHISSHPEAFPTANTRSHWPCCRVRELFDAENGLEERSAVRGGNSICARSSMRQTSARVLGGAARRTRCRLDDDDGDGDGHAADACGAG
eukprot:4667485-Pleurochrysis_carterae.AAC.2